MDSVVRRYSIDGMYGRVKDIVKLPNQTNDIMSHNFTDVDTYSGKLIGEGESIEGLPKNITKDDYFRIALLDVLRDIRDELKKDVFVNVKTPVDVTISNVSSIIEKIKENK